MSGLIKKDLYILSSNLNASFLIILAVFIIIPLLSGSTGIMSVMLPVVCATLSLNLLSYDKQCEWEQYAAALPVTRKQTVTAHYIMTYALMFVGVALGLIVSLISRLFVPDSPPAAELLIASAAGLIGVLLYINIITPLIYKFGVEKSRLLIILVMVPVMGALALAQKVQANASEILSGVVSGAAVIAVVLVIIAVCAVSYFASVAIYEKKEF